MIARLWRGRTPAEKADSYLDYLGATGVEACRSTPGNCGVFVLRRDQDGVSEFLFLSLWDSAESITKFAGANPDQAVYYPEDEEYLLELDPRVTHYDIGSAVGLDTGRR